MTTTPQPSPFWIVWNSAGQNPSYRHPLRSQAEEEAKRLAIANPNQEFFVLQVESRYLSEKVSRTEYKYDNPEDVPF